MGKYNAMVLSAAFRHTRPLLAEPARGDVSPAMVKWWKPGLKDNGQITRSLSPYEQEIVEPWLRSFPKRDTTNSWEAVIGVLQHWLLYMESQLGLKPLMQRKTFTIVSKYRH